MYFILRQRLSIVVTLFTVSISVYFELRGSNKDRPTSYNKFQELIEKVKKSEKVISLSLNRGQDISLIAIVLDFSLLLKWINDTNMAPIFSYWGIEKATIVWISLVGVHLFLFFIATSLGILHALKIEREPSTPYFSLSMIASLLIGLISLFSALLIISGRISIILSLVTLK